MSGNGPCRNAVPVIGFPVKFAYHGAQGQRSVIAAAGDHNVCAAAERFSNRKRAKINIGALHARADRAERLAGIHIGESDAALQQLVELRHDVIARDHANLHSSAVTRCLQYGSHGIFAANRIHSAGVGHNFHASLHNLARAALDHADKIMRVSGARIARLQLLQDRHGDLSQIVEREVVERSAAQELQRCFL